MPELELLELEDELLEPDEDELLEPDEDELLEPDEDELLEPDEDELLEPDEDELLEPDEDELLEPDEDELLELEDELLDDVETQLSIESLHILPGTVPSQHVGTVPTAELLVMAASAQEGISLILHSAVKPPLVQDTEPLEQKGVESTASAL